MLIPFLIPFIIAMFLSINMGGSGTAPAFSAAFGANVIKKSLIPGLFGLAVFAGAIIGGEQTAKTIVITSYSIHYTKLYDAGTNTGSS